MPVQFTTSSSPNEGNKLREIRRQGFRLVTWDTGRRDGRRCTTIGYRFWDNGKLIFEGEDFNGSPMSADDSDETVCSLLSFLSLRPGDTDREYFDNYTPEQMEWFGQRGEDLSLLVMEWEERLERKRQYARNRADRSHVIEIQVNGDPFGGGFVGSESTDSGNSWFYRGDVGSQSRQWWRNYCRRERIVLRMA